MHFPNDGKAEGKISPWKLMRARQQDLLQKNSNLLSRGAEYRFEMSQWTKASFNVNAEWYCGGAVVIADTVITPF